MNFRLLKTIYVHLLACYLNKPQNARCNIKDIYISDLQGIINNITKPTIFVDDTNITFTHSNLTDFKHQINIVIEKKKQLVPKQFISSKL